jgi:hypothetical protein
MKARNSRMAVVKIKKGNVLLTCDRTDLVDVAETADGMSFTLKGGLQFYITDAYMPPAFKQQIAMSVNRFEGASVTIDYDNIRKPVLVEM